MRRSTIPQCRNGGVIRGPRVSAVVVIAAIILAGPGSRGIRPAEAGEAMQAGPAPVDGQRAYGYLKAICKIGPRIAGSPENAQQRKLVAEHFKKMKGEVREQPFQAQHPLTGRRVDMVNLIGSWHPERTQRVLISAHYDTRPYPDQEEDPERARLPFLGANDCASGVALLMEIANHLEKLETSWGVDLVLFDGEELVYGDRPRRGDYFLGSKFFARSYARQAERRGNKTRYVAGILLDMVGGRDLQLKREPNSVEMAPALVREVWAVARQVGARSFVNDVGREVLDDHLPLNEARIPSIDLIDFDYPYWHKADDVPENCSAESLAEVGRVLTAWLAQPRRTRR